MTQAADLVPAAAPAAAEAPPPAPGGEAGAPPPVDPKDLIKFLPDDDDYAPPAAAAKPADEPAKPKPVVKEKDEVEDRPDNKKFVAMRRQEKELRAEKERLDAERKQILAARKEWEALQKERELYADDPGKYLEWYAKTKGVTVQEAFKRITHRLASGEAPIEESPVAKDVAALKAEVESLRAEREQARQAAAATQYKATLTSEIAAAADDLPYLAGYEPAEIAEHIFAVIQTEYSRTGKVLDAKDVLSDIHDRQKARFEKDRAAIERRLGSRNQSATQSASPRGENREAVRHIPNGVANQRPTVIDKDDPEERYRRAMEEIKFIDD